MSASNPREAEDAAPGPVVTIEGREARVALPEGVSGRMGIDELLGRLRPGRPDSCGAILPDGVKCLWPMRSGCVAVHQTPPRVHAFRWIDRDSPSEYGAGTAYRSVRLALPYLVVLAVFGRTRGGGILLSNRNECFFSNEPLDTRGLDTELRYPALLNCSRFPDDPAHPLSWICTQKLPRGEISRPAALGESLRGGLGALLRHLLESGFNRSSEHHEISSWFSETVAARVDPRLESVESWQRASADDPLFALDVPWLPTGRTLREVLERIGAARGRTSSRPVTAEDVARAILNAKPAHEGKE